MNIDTLKSTAKELVAPGKGILAADESTGTIKKRFDAVGVESTSENHRIYRQMLFKTLGIEEFISGVIMYDETIRQHSDEGIPLPKLLSDKGIIPGIKVDKGTVGLENFPSEKITEGLDGLRERLGEYSQMGARFTKWRAVIKIGEKIPSEVCITSNADGLARFAALSQEADLTPIIEPEVLMDGNHDLEKCEEVTYKTLKTVFSYLDKHKVYLPGLLLKPNMMIPGKDNQQKAESSEIAEATIRCFSMVVPEEVPGVVFLSGGQSPEEATLNLNELNKKDKVPWQLSFSYGRALQEPVLKAWGGKPENIEKAQQEFYKRAKLNSLARKGKYQKEMEEEE